LKNVDTFYGRLECFTDIWDILWPLGTYCAHLVHFFLFWYHAPRKIWQPCSAQKIFVEASRWFREEDQTASKLSSSLNPIRLAFHSVPASSWGKNPSSGPGASAAGGGVGSG
jgi:hypothetical protein